MGALCLLAGDIDVILVGGFVNMSASRLLGAKVLCVAAFIGYYYITEHRTKQVPV